MRPIKFRAWDSKNNEWLLGYEYENLGGFSMFGEIMLMDEWNAVVHAHHRGEIDLKLMQYTGLKDKNGVEIYEGDIVKNDHSIFHISGVVEYAESEAGFRVKTTDKPDYLKLAEDLPFKWSQVEVIGNIYENPELLEVRS